MGYALFHAQMRCLRQLGAIQGLFDNDDGTRKYALIFAIISPFSRGGCLAGNSRCGGEIPIRR